MKYQKPAAIGKHFLVEVAGTHITDEEKRALERLRPAAIMLRKRNFIQHADYETWLAQYKTLITQFREILPKELIISIDHEGGRVTRPPQPITKFPYAFNWPNSVEQVATAMAIELKSLAINVNFAPVADIHSNPNNPVINERAFGITPSLVSKAAQEFARTMKANGIAACAKHFPGHGDTKTDSHFGVPVLDLNLDELKKRELIPFQSLISSGIEMIMTAHILFPKIDAHNTATLSKAILNDLLREEMGFRGVIIADALGMAAISKNISELHGLTKAINAGLDIFLVAGDNVTINNAIKMSELLLEAVANGDIAEAVLQRSEERIDKFVNALPQYEVTTLDGETFTKHQKIAQDIEKMQTAKEFELNLPGFD